MEEMTPREVARFMVTLEDTLDDHERRLRKSETDLAVQGQRVDSLALDMKTVKDNTTWILRVVVGALVSGGIGLLFMFGGKA